MIQEITKILSAVCKRQELLEQSMNLIMEKVDRISNLVGPPDGRIILNGSMRTSLDEVEQMLRNPMRHHMEAVDLEFQVSSAVYLSLMPDAQERIKKLFSEAQIEKIRSLLEIHQQLLRLVENMEGKINNLTQYTMDVQTRTKFDIRAFANQKVSEEVNRLAVIRASFEDRMAQLDRGLSNCAAALKKATEAEARVRCLMPSKDGHPHRIATAQGV